MASRRTIKLPRAAHEAAALAQVSPLVEPTPLDQQPPITPALTAGGELTETTIERRALDNGRFVNVECVLRGGKLVSERIIEAE